MTSLENELIDLPTNCKECKNIIERLNIKYTDRIKEKGVKYGTEPRFLMTLLNEEERNKMNASECLKFKSTCEIDYRDLLQELAEIHKDKHTDIIEEDKIDYVDIIKIRGKLYTRREEITMRNGEKHTHIIIEPINEEVGRKTSSWWPFSDGRRIRRTRRSRSFKKNKKSRRSRRRRRSKK